MKHGKRRLALLLTAALCICTLPGCGQSGDGLTLSVCVGGEPEELDPIYAVEPADQTLLIHLYENLMRKTTDVSGEVVVSEAAARHVTEEENADGTVTYTFQIGRASCRERV